MSDLPEQSPAAEPSKPKKPAKEKGRWRRRIRRTLIVLIVLAVAFRLILYVALGPVLRRVGRSMGFDITYARQEMMLLSGDVGLWYLKVTPLTGGAPVFQADYLRGSISPMALLKGRLLVERAEADGVAVTLERDENGNFPLLDRFTSAPLVPAPGNAPAAKPKAPLALDFSSPLLIEAFRMQQVRATIIDKSVKPEVHATISMNARLSELGFAGRPWHFDLDLWCDPALDSLRVNGEFSGQGRHLVADARVIMRGLHLKPLEPYLAPLGIKPIADDINMDLTLKLLTDPVPPPSKAVSAMLSIDGIRVTADDQPVASLKHMAVQADSADATTATIAQILVEGARLDAIRMPDGLVRVAGLELGGAPPASPKPPRAAPAPATRPSNGSPPYGLVVHDVILRDLAAMLLDQAGTPSNELKFHLVEFAAKGQVIDPNNPASVIPISGKFEAPGIIKEIQLDGLAKPFGTQKSLELGVVADGIRPDALKQYLSAVGIESMLKSAHFEGKLTAAVNMPEAGGVTADAHLAGLKLTDGDDLFAMQDINIRGAGVDPQNGRLKAEVIELNGPIVDVTLDPAGRLVVANLRISPPRKAAPSPVASSAPATTLPMAVPSLPRIELGHFVWQGGKLGLHDEQIQPASSVAIDNVGADVSDLVIDLSAAEAAKPSKFKFWVDSPQIARRLSAEGTIAAAPNSLAAQVAVRGEGIQSAALAPYVKPLGFETTLHDGTLQLDAKLSLTQQAEGLSASLGLTDMKLSDDGQELVGVDGLQVDELSLLPGAIDVKSIHVTKPRAHVTREADGAFAAAGIRIPPPSTQPSAPATQPAPGAPANLVASLHELRVDDARLGWTDRMMSTPVDIIGHASVELGNAVIGKPSPPATYRTTLSADGILDELVISGTANPSPDAPALTARIEGRGIRAGAAAAYLPPGMELSTRDGRLRASIEASVGKSEPGGNSIRLIVSDVDWRDGQQADPFLALQSFRVVAPRVDLPGNVIDVEEISLAGLQAGAELAPGGATQAIGVTLKPVPPPTTEPAAPAPTTAAAPQDLGRLIAEARRPLPLLTVQKLDIGVRRASVRDLNQPDAAPLALQEFRLVNAEPIRLGGPDGASQPPVRLELAGQISPVIGRFDVKTSATPLAQEPTVTIELAAAGIRGSGLTELAPALKEKINGVQMVDGRFKTHVEAHVRLDRRGPRDIDFSRPFQLELAIDGTEFRSEPDGPITAGLDGFHAEQLRIDPKSGSVVVRTVELTKPRARILKDADGIHAFGLVLPPPSTAPSTAPSEAPPIAAAPSTAPAIPGPEMKIDHLIISGLDLRVEDRTATPPVIIPLNGLEVEARNLTTRAFTEPQTTRFSVLVNSDKVRVPVRQTGGGVLGTIGGLANMAAGNRRAPTTVQVTEREFFAQIAVTGSMNLYPEPRGFVKTSVNSMELCAVQGAAAEEGVKLNGGVLDANVDARFRDDGVLDTRAQVLFTDLDMEDSSDGRIAKALRFPAPLEAVIATLQKADGSIQIPLNVQMHGSSVSYASLTAAATEALLVVVTNAIANAPVKVVGSAADLIGIGGLLASRKPDDPQPVEIRFAAGSALVDPAARARIDALLATAKKNSGMQLTLRSELGGADVALANRRANPPPADCQAMAEQLRGQKFALLQRRSDLASQVRAELAALSPGQSSASVQQLRLLDQQIANVEESMDQVDELLRPGAERQAARRTRAAALNVAQARIDGVAELLRSSGLPDTANRVNITAAQFNPTETDEGGRIVILPIMRKQ